MYILVVSIIIMSFFFPFLSLVTRQREIRNTQKNKQERIQTQEPLNNTVSELTNTTK